MAVEGATLLTAQTAFLRQGYFKSSQGQGNDGDGSDDFGEALTLVHGDSFGDGGRGNWYWNVVASLERRFC